MCIYLFFFLSEKQKIYDLSSSIFILRDILLSIILFQRSGKFQIL